MFDASLIPHQASEGLQHGYVIRPLEASDYDKGVLQVLTALTDVGTVSKAEFEELYEYWATTGASNRPGKLASRVFYPVVIESDTHQIAASGMLVVEQKLIHSRALAGHIEDISVSASHQGMKLGKRLIAALTGVGKAVGCYKIILDCDDKNVGFYEKCGYSRAGVEMQTRT